MCCKVWQPRGWQRVWSRLLIVTVAKASILVMNFVFQKSYDGIDLRCYRPELLDNIL